MKRYPPLLTFVCAGCLLILGCAAPEVQQEKAEQPPPVDPRTAQLFQKRCDDSMLQAAIARWNDGDVSGCESLLERLLERNPSHLEARMTLADLQLSEGNVPAAETHLRWIVQHNPQNPQARHSLGMLLDTTGRHDEALVHLREATRLDPQNELYAMCEQSALGLVTTGSTPIAMSTNNQSANLPATPPLPAAHSNSSVRGAKR